MKSYQTFPLLFVSLAAGLTAVQGCGSDKASGAPAAGGVSGTGGGASTGGANGGGGAGTGGAAATGGIPNVPDVCSPGDAVITGTVTQCTGTTAGTLPNECVPGCARPECGHAACITTAQISQYAPSVDQTVIGLLGDCPGQAAGTKCVPIDYIATTGDFLVKSCTSISNLVGRCISKCIPKVYDQALFLPKDTCGDDEVCAPCYDPRYPVGDPGADTQACRTGCDTFSGVDDPATKYDTCAVDNSDGGTNTARGICVPANLVPAAYDGLLPQLTCAANFVCAPTEKARNLNYNFPTCTPNATVQAAGPLPGPNGELGGCVPKYLVEFVAPAGAALLTRETCAAGDLCAPCTNPLSNNTVTGACPL